MKTIKWNEEQFKNVQKNLLEYLQSVNFDTQKIKEYKDEDCIWKISHEKTDELILIKNRNNHKNTSGDMLRFYFEESGAEQPLLTPNYILVDENNKKMNMIFMRSQDAEKTNSGTAFQKLGSLTFVVKDYLRRYKKVHEYDIDVTVILNDAFNHETLKHFLMQLKENSINIWINQIKI